jgi:uncharacterized protein YllA (UPF0747 family)
MNFGKLYSDVTASTIENENISPDGVVTKEQKEQKQHEETAAQSHLKMHWLQSSITEKFLKELDTKHKEYLTEAIALAVSFHQHQNFNKIISNLVRAHELSKILAQMKHNS